MSSSEAPVLLTVRGTLAPADLESARNLHNETAGSEPGIAAARSLGDLSHKVFAPCTRASAFSSAKPGELLFIDNWVDAQGIMQFFSNVHVQEQGNRMFTAKEPAVWMRARGGYAFNLPAAMGKDERYVGMIRATVKSPEQTIDAFRTVGAAILRDARRRGQLSHEIFFKINPPGVEAPIEVLGIDMWSSLPGLLEQYGDRSHLAPLMAAFAGPPAATVWEQPAGKWSEW